MAAMFDQQQMSLAQMAQEAEFAIDMPSDEQEAADAEKERVAMADQKLIALIRQREDNAYGDDTDSVSLERARALDMYLGRPLGNEIEGRSQVVSKDLYDTVETILPVMQRIFAAGDNVCDWQPQNEDDADAATQESDYTNYIIQRRNPWFMLAYYWFKDALITKNAYAMAHWAETNDASLEKYDGLTDDQMVLIGNDPQVEIVEHEAYQQQVRPPIQFLMQAMAQGMQQAFPPMNLHNVKVRRTTNYGCTKITILPPERCLVAHDADKMSVRDSGFFEYWENKTISDLREAGFQVEDDLSDSGAGTTNDTTVDIARDASSLTTQRWGDQESADPSMRKVKTRTCWVKTDYDGDGIAELRYVVLVGDTVLANEEVSCIPVASIVPYPMPHRHLGLSLYDVVGDLQIIKTMMLRAGVDNQFLGNNGRTGVDKNLVNLDDMAVSRPGGMVRVDGPPGASIMPFTHANTVAGTVSFIDYLDGVRMDRAGVQKPMAGADMDAIMAAPGTIAQLASAASQKMELIARIFAEGVKELFQVVHEVTLTNATVQDKIELRGEWVTIDPRTWRKRNDLTLSVGMGVGNKQSHTASIAALLGLQKQALGLGLTDLNKMYAGLSEMTKALGFGSAGQFFTEPKPDAQLPPPPSDPRIIVAGIQSEAKQVIENMQGQNSIMVEQLKQGSESQRLQFKEMMDILNEREERLLRSFSEATERAQEMRLASDKSAGSIGDGVALSHALRKAEEAVSATTTKAEDIGRRTDSLEASVKAVLEGVAELKKPRRRKIKAPSGKSYDVSEE